MSPIVKLCLLLYIQFNAIIPVAMQIFNTQGLRSKRRKNLLWKLVLVFLLLGIARMSFTLGKLLLS